MFSSFPKGDLRLALRWALRASFSCLSRVLFSVIPQIASALSSSPIFSSCLAVRIFQWNGPGKWNMPDLHAYDAGVALAGDLAHEAELVHLTATYVGGANGEAGRGLAAANPNRVRGMRFDFPQGERARLAPLGSCLGRNDARGGVRFVEG